MISLFIYIVIFPQFSLACWVSWKILRKYLEENCIAYTDITHKLITWLYIYLYINLTNICIKKLLTQQLKWCDRSYQCIYPFHWWSRKNINASSIYVILTVSDSRLTYFSLWNTWLNQILVSIGPEPPLYITLILSVIVLWIYCFLQGWGDIPCQCRKDVHCQYRTDIKNDC